MIAIINGNIVQEHGVLKDHALLIEKERIYDIVPQAELTSMCIEEVYNAYGGYITPGFIDMHSDHIEAMAAPRPSSIMDMELAVYEFEKECCTHGITTMFHSVSIWEGVGASPMRRPTLVRQLADIIEKSHTQLHLIHHRFHMRFEIDNQKQFGLMLDYLRQKRVHLLSFMDHTPGQGQYRNIEVYKNYIRNVKSMSEAEVEEEVARRMSSDKLTLENIRKAAALAKAVRGNHIGISTYAGGSQGSEKPRYVHRCRGTEYSAGRQSFRKYECGGCYRTGCCGYLMQ